MDTLVAYAKQNTQSARSFLAQEHVPHRRLSAGRPCRRLAWASALTPMTGVNSAALEGSRLVAGAEALCRPQIPEQPWERGGAMGRVLKGLNVQRIMRQ
eukprot:3405739-Amphidinium_carterae.2